jgi:mRNA interferase HicA
MTGNEFIRKVKALGKVRNTIVTLSASRGKGSHQTLYYGTAFTIVRNPKDAKNRYIPCNVPAARHQVT